MLADVEVIEKNVFFSFVTYELSHYFASNNLLISYRNLTY